MADEQARRKRAAAERAVEQVQAGMVVGLGSGSTAEFAIRALGERVAHGLTIAGVATSRRSGDLARELGIPLAELQDVARIDLAIDGADEVARDTLDVVKGHGGALLREKLVALAATRRVIVVDDGKVVDRLGTRCAVPIEVVPFGRRLPEAALLALGGQPTLRLLPGSGEPFVTDNGNVILDVDFGPISDPAALAQAIKAITGVVDHGLFIAVADQVIVGGADGVDLLER